MSVPTEQERFAGTLVFPDGEVVTTLWKSIRSPSFVRHPVHEKNLEASGSIGLGCERLLMAG